MKNDDGPTGSNTASSTKSSRRSPQRTPRRRQSRKGREYAETAEAAEKQMDWKKRGTIATVQRRRSSSGIVALAEQRPGVERRPGIGFVFLADGQAVAKRIGLGESLGMEQLRGQHFQQPRQLGLFFNKTCRAPGHIGLPWCSRLSLSGHRAVVGLQTAARGISSRPDELLRAAGSVP